MMAVLVLIELANLIVTTLLLAVVLEEKLRREKERVLAGEAVGRLRRQTVEALYAEADNAGEAAGGSKAANGPTP